MKLYNSLTNQKEEFRPSGDRVRMYACGPTVYNFFHIGNARCFVLFDMLRRYLEYRGFPVSFVQNFTDIDDKMIRRAAEEGTDVKTVADKYIAEYFTDARGLGIREATFHPRATENMAEIIDIIRILIEKGYAYESGGDVYFSARKFREYGKLSKTNVDDLESGARIDVNEIKRDPLDFALWKAYKEGEPFWESPWGKGRPGWHIECTAMANKYLGKSIDIHCGGQDLAFPHHENEIAQSEAAFGVPFARFWLHNGYINVDNKKMSKSEGNFFTVRQAAEKFSYPAIRFFLLASHYRSPVNFSSDALQSAKASLERLYNCERSLCHGIEHAPDGAPQAEKTAPLFAHREKFLAVMDDDFNTADGIAAIFELVKEINILRQDETLTREDYRTMLALYTELAHLMGFAVPEEDGGDDAQIQALVDKRTEAKKARDFALADEIRDNLKKMGVLLEDTPQGTTWRRQ